MTVFTKTSGSHPIGPPEVVPADGIPAAGTAEAAPLDVSALFREHFDYVWRSLRSFGVPLEGVDDAVQEVFMTVHRRLSEFSGRSSIRTWIYSIAYLTAQNHRRKRQRRQHENLHPNLSSTSPGPGEHLANAQASRFVANFSDHLSEEKRAIFVLCILEELSAPDASEVLGLKLNTVYSRIRLVRGEFRTALQRFSQREKVS